MSGELSGLWFARGSSRDYPARLSRNGDELRLVVDGAPGFLANIREVEISPRLSTVPRRIELPNRGVFICDDNDAVDRFLGKQSGYGSLLSRFESRWTWALMAVFVVPLLIYAFFQLAMPSLARPIANLVPWELKRQLDDRVLDVIADYMSAELNEDSANYARLQGMLWRLTDEPDQYRILVLDVPDEVGANAFALPGGSLVFTDKLLQLGVTDGELTAVMAHEMGHVDLNHGMRSLIQNASFGMTVALLIGDPGVLTEFVFSGALTMMQAMAYSRDFEREADAYAVEKLVVTGVPATCIGSLLGKIEASMARVAEEHAEEDEGADSDESSSSQFNLPASLQTLLSSHPDTVDRPGGGRLDCGA